MITPTGIASAEAFGTATVAELFELGATDAQQLVIAWLAPLGYRAAIKRKSGEPFPFVVVHEIVATEDCDQMDAYPLLSLHILGETEAQVDTAAALVHRRMQVLARDPLQDIVLADSRVTSISWLEIVERPHWEYYADSVFQKIGRYKFAQPFTDIEE